MRSNEILLRGWREVALPAAGPSRLAGMSAPHGVWPLSWTVPPRLTPPPSRIRAVDLGLKSFLVVRI